MTYSREALLGPRFTESWSIACPWLSTTAKPRDVVLLQTDTLCLEVQKRGHLASTQRAVWDEEMGDRQQQACGAASGYPGPEWRQECSLQVWGRRPEGMGGIAPGHSPAGWRPGASLDTHGEGQIPLDPSSLSPSLRPALSRRAVAQLFPGKGAAGLRSAWKPTARPTPPLLGPQAAAGRKVAVLPPPGAFGEYNPRPASLSLRLGGRGSGGWGFRRGISYLLFLFLHAITESFKHEQKQ